MNWIVILASGLTPLIIGGIYYHPKVLGNAAARAAGASASDMQRQRRPKVYIFTLLLGLLLAVFIIPNVLHFNHLYSMIALPGNGPGSEAAQDVAAFLGKYGNNFRTFGHGAFHGILTALFGAWPILGTIAVFEMRSWRYTAIHLGYWVIVLALMGGVVCAWA
jgi:Protein of unknown function (DUF1761)